MTDKAKPNPIFLLADSQILFWKKEEQLFIDRIRQILNETGFTNEPKAAYIGASNQDNPQFYDIFVAAMSQIQITNCRLIPSEPQPEDNDFLNNANLILLSGGETERGLRVIRENGFDEKMLERYYQGAILIGISAGAIQLGLKGWRQDEKKEYFMLDTLKILPYVIDVHDEEGDWNRLRIAVEGSGKYTKGFGIPFGGAAIFHDDWSIEAVRHSLTEYSYLDNGIKHSLILPPESKKDNEKENP